MWCFLVLVEIKTGNNVRKVNRIYFSVPFPTVFSFDIFPLFLYFCQITTTMNSFFSWIHYICVSFTSILWMFSIIWATILIYFCKFLNQHMWPLLKTGGGTGTERSAAVVASLSARVGSIGDNHLGGWHSYRSSKTALNQCMTSPSWSLIWYCYALVNYELKLSQLFEMISLVFSLSLYCNSVEDSLGGIRKEEGSNHMYIIASWYGWHRSF